jgi:hypothetical protein
LKSSAALLLIWLLWPSDARPAELIPFVKDKRLGVIVRDTRLPQSVHKDLASGLTNRILIRVTLLKGSAPVARRVIDVAIKYDLWEETFNLAVTVADGVVAARAYPSMDKVIAALSRLKLPDLFPAGELAEGNEFKLTAELLFDPVDNARLAEIRKWVAENSKDMPVNPTDLGAVIPAPSSDSRTLFNRIFEQYATGISVSAGWSDTAASRSFRPLDLRDEE